MAGYPWYRWFVESWLASETRHSMTMEERGMYREALDIQAVEGSIPRDLNALRRRLACDPDEFARSWPKVAEKFVPHLTDRLINLRLKDEIERREEIRNKRVQSAVSGGKQSGKARRSKREANASILSKQKRSKNEVDRERDREPSSRKGLRPTGACQPGVDPPTDLVKIWNENCGDLPRVLKCGKSRLMKIKARLKGSQNGEFVEQFRAAVVKSRNVPFLQGDNDRGWPLNFDFLIANDDNVSKVLEGKYGGVVNHDPPETPFEWTPETLMERVGFWSQNWADLGKSGRSDIMAELQRLSEQTDEIGRIATEAMAEVDTWSKAS